MLYGEKGDADIMNKFLYTLSIILVVAKIFNLVTFTWGLCLLPALLVIIYRTVMSGFILGKASDLLKDIEELDEENKE